MTLQPGDTIKSASNSQAEITLFDGSVIEISPDTEIKISDLSTSGTGTTSIKMRQQIGKTVSRVKKLTDTESRYEIETPAAVASVRGSTMIVTVYADGVTVVMNEAGDIRVAAQGVEVIIPVGMKVTIVSGQPPGKPEPIDPTPTPAPTTAPSGGGEGGGGGIATPTPTYRAAISTRVEIDHPQAYIGQTVIYTYTISNTGNVQLSSISISDNVNGVPVYQSGDTDTDTYLDPGETWVYTAFHVVSINDPSPLVGTASFSATVNASTTLVAQDQVTVTILQSDLAVEITSPANGAVIDTGSVDISGTVNDASISSGTATVNGNARSISVTGGSFSFSANLSAGQNTVSVNVTNSAGAPANDSVTLIRSAPAISIVNTANTAKTTVGNIITYTYQVTNPGNMPLAGISLTDTVTGNIAYQSGDNGNGTLDPGEQWSYITNHTTEDADVVTLVNMASAEGTYAATGQKITASAPVNVTVIGNYDIRIELTWDTPGSNLDAHLMRPGGVINHPADDCYYGNQHPDWGTPDSLWGDAYLEYDDQDGYGPETIYISNPFESGVYKYAVHYRGGSGGSARATITVWYYGTKLETWQKTLVNGETWNCINFNWGLVNFILGTPFILLQKEASVVTAYPGDNITYTYYVGNYGNAALTSVQVTDEKIPTGAVYQSGDSNGNGLLDIGEAWVFRAIYTVTAGDTSLLTTTATARATVTATGVEVFTWATTSVVIRSR